MTAMGIPILNYQVSINDNIVTIRDSNDKFIESKSFDDKMQMGKYLSKWKYLNLNQWWKLPFINKSEIARRFSEKSGLSKSSFYLKAERRNGNKFSQDQFIILKTIINDIITELQKFD